MTKIRDLKSIFSIFLILFITTVSTQNLSPVLCGGLHSGIDPCKECSDDQALLVRGQALPKPLVVDTTANQLKSRLTHGWKRSPKLLRSRSQVLSKRKPYLKNTAVMQMEPTDAERFIQYVPEFQQVQMKVPNVVNSNVKLAPKFHPIGDLCYKKGSRPEPASRFSESIIITPANPPKIECYTESSAAKPLDSSAMLNAMMRSQTYPMDVTGQIPQLSTGSSRTKFKVQGPRRNDELKSGSVNTNRRVNVNTANSDVRMRDYTVNLNAQNSNRMMANRFKSDEMNSYLTIENTMNRAYPRKSVTVGVVPRTKGVQRIPYLATPRATIFGTNAGFYSGHSDGGISEYGRQNSGMSLNTQERMYNGESVSSSPLANSTADLVSLSLKYKNIIESYQNAASNVGEINHTPNVKISEEKLSYGPRKTPLNDQVIVPVKEIPEEKLHIVEKPVIELQLNKPSASLRAYEEPAQPLTYGDLGFREKTFDGPRFQERSMIFEAPDNDPEPKMVLRGPANYLQYLVADTSVAGELVPGKPQASLGYVPTYSHFTSNVHNSAHRRISPVQSHYQHINEQPNLRSYSVSNANVGQLMTNNQMPSPFNHQEVCFCT